MTSPMIQFNFWSSAAFSFRDWRANQEFLKSISTFTDAISLFARYDKVKVPISHAS